VNNVIITKLFPQKIIIFPKLDILMLRAVEVYGEKKTLSILIFLNQYQESI